MGWVLRSPQFFKHKQITIMKNSISFIFDGAELSAPASEKIISLNKVLIAEDKNANLKAELGITSVVDASEFFSEVEALLSEMGKDNPAFKEYFDNKDKFELEWSSVTDYEVKDNVAILIHIVPNNMYQLAV